MDLQSDKFSRRVLQLLSMLVMILGGFAVLLNTARIADSDDARGIFGVVIGIVMIGCGVFMDRDRMRMSSSKKSLP